MKIHKIAVIAGDGLGPEVINEGIKVLKKLKETSNLSLLISDVAANTIKKQEK